MKGNVFQCHVEKTNTQQFLRTVGVLDEHVNKTFEFPQDLASVCKSFAVTKIVQPANLSKNDYDNDMGKKLKLELLFQVLPRLIPSG